MRREPLHPGVQRSLFPSLEFRYWGFYTDQPGGSIDLDATMRAHSHVEQHIQRLKDSGLCRFPFNDSQANQAWLMTVAKNLTDPDQAAQRPFYSGKKKTHTTKTIAVCDGSSNLLWATPLVAGATHDLTALRDANLPAHLAESCPDVLADSGFQGLQREVPAIDLPTRRRHRNELLTAVDRFFNSVLASARVRVEHAIGRLKQWRCLTVPKQRRDLLERWLPVCGSVRNLVGILEDDEGTVRARMTGACDH